MIFNRELTIIQKRGLDKKGAEKNKGGYDPLKNHGLVRFIKSI